MEISEVSTASRPLVLYGVRLDHEQQSALLDRPMITTDLAVLDTSARPCFIRCGGTLNISAHATTIDQALTH
jgi:hypothetical protein